MRKLNQGMLSKKLAVKFMKCIFPVVIILLARIQTSNATEDFRSACQDSHISLLCYRAVCNVSSPHVPLPVLPVTVVISLFEEKREDSHVVYYDMRVLVDTVTDVASHKVYKWHAAAISFAIPGRPCRNDMHLYH